MKKILSAFCLLLIVFGCSKNETLIAPAPIYPNPNYITYTILQGQHYCDKNSFRPFNANQMAFKVKFDSTAIYQSSNAANQFDINKLYGFSEGQNHHINSARIGWVWNKNALRLYAYVYSDSTRKMKEITAVGIGEEISCSIGISGKQYVFSVNKISTSLERSIEGPAVAGYWLYPYFGGDETAPHNIFIDIMDAI
ncbi:MAG: hypothetical protein H7Z13_18180 [Ferruginibacter sp.]|nr:hypothetical protein [Ferruginibacter sp.]